MPFRFLALGDSYTIGEAVPPDERWPTRVAALLREQGLSIAEPELIATTGWTTDELSAAINAAAPRGPYDLVSLLIGVNDQYRGRDVPAYRTGFRALLDCAITLAAGEPGRVIVVSIPDWGVTPFAEGRDRRQIAAEIDAFNAANRDDAERAGARYVDITPASRRPGAPVAADELHPAGEAYAEWAALIVRVARDILAGVRP